jgi:hypothetical protein
LLCCCPFRCSQLRTQPTPPEAHVAIAKTAAGEDYQNLFNFLCAAPAQREGEAAEVAAQRLEHRVGKVVEVQRLEHRADKAVVRGERRTDRPGMRNP